MLYLSRYKPASVLLMQFEMINEMLDELLQDKLKLDIPTSSQEKMKVLPEQDNVNTNI